MSIGEHICELIPSNKDWYKLDTSYDVKKLSQTSLKVREEGTEII